MKSTYADWVAAGERMRPGATVGDLPLEMYVDALDTMCRVSSKFLEDDADSRRSLLAGVDVPADARTPQFSPLALEDFQWGVAGMSDVQAWVARSLLPAAAPDRTP